MKRSLATVFCNYTYHDRYFSKILWEYFKKELRLWAGTFDHLYLIDSDFDFSPDDIDYIKSLGIELSVFRTHNLNAGQNLTFIVKQVQEEALLLIHPDMIIYDKTVINRGFYDLESGTDTVAIFDGSGKKLSDRFPLMEENQFRTERRRFCNYLWFQRNEWFKRIPDLDFEPVGKFGDYIEATSYVTEKLLEMGVKVIELRDDRSNILMDIKPFKIAKLQWSDPQTKEWGKDYPLRLGYYHVRNGNGGAELVNEFQNIRYSYERRKKTMPLTEMARLLGWYQLIADVAKMPVAITPVVNDLGIETKDWDEYMREFYKFHDYALI